MKTPLLTVAVIVAATVALVTGGLDSKDYATIVIAAMTYHAGYLTPAPNPPPFK